MNEIVGVVGQSLDATYAIEIFSQTIWSPVVQLVGRFQGSANLKFHFPQYLS